MRDPSDGACYAYNDLNAQYAPLDGRYDKHNLPDDAYKVIVTLRPANGVEVTEEFRLENCPQLKLGRP